MFNIFQRISFLLVITFILISCGGGGSLPKSSEVISEAILSGVAMLGPIANADVNIYSYDEGVRGNIALESSRTNIIGEYTIPFTSKSRPILVCVKKW